MKNIIPCELCTTNILKGLVYKMKSGFYVCQECKDELEESEPIDFDGTETS